MRRHIPYSRRRSGFSLLEMMVAMAVFLAVMGAAASIYQMQSRTIAQQAGRLEAQQNARFALTMIERELRMGGLALADGQPSLVEASATAVVFNTNLVSKDSLDISAVYFNKDADIRAVSVFPAAKALKLPGTSDFYPDTSYELSPGTPSNAETIAFWLSKDSTSTRSDEYILFRRTNYTAALVVTKGVIIGANDTVFQYFALDTSGTLKPVSLARLPATHTMKMHKATGDTGVVALVDSIRAVKVRLKILYKDPRGLDAIREFAGRVTILNAGAAQRATCGDKPLSVAPAAVVGLDPDGNSYVHLTWTPSVDENGGEKDVERYTIYRRDATAVDFESALGSVPAGEASYDYSDLTVTSGGQYVYGVIAQDCTPAASSMMVTPIIIVP